MLQLAMSAKGRFPNKMIRGGEFAREYFDEKFNFLFKAIDESTGMVSDLHSDSSLSSLYCPILSDSPLVCVFEPPCLPFILPP